MREIRPFRFEVPQADLDDLARRLDATRWPDAETPDDWSQGVPLAYTRELCEHLRTRYDWRRCEAELNALPQFITEIDGLDIQFMHVRSPHEDALPMVMTHGWPGSVIEFMKVIGPLTDPTAHGGRAEDAFHVVCPTLPGFGWSGKPTSPGWGVEHIGRAWGQLMQRLGYGRWVAQGGDWGALITDCIARSEPPQCIAIHTNMPILTPSAPLLENLTDFEQAALARMQLYWDWECGYSKEQSTRPQTLGYGLVDSPVAQVAWVGEKYWCWTDCDGHPDNIFTRDEMLDNIMMYWLPAAGASSARIYWESFRQLGTPQPDITIPVGVSIFPAEIFRSSRRWCEERFKNLIHYNQLPAGGHFAAFEQPEMFIDEVRTCFRQVR